jgi:comEA protein
MRKPPYKTSEFWFTLVSFIFSGLFLCGFIDEPDTRDDLTDVFTHVTESIVLLGGQAMVLSRYIRKRKEEKIEYEKTRQKEQDNIRKELEDYVGVDKSYHQININKATLGELVQLPHIGPITAQEIIKYRNSHGNFDDIQDIIKVNGIGQSVFNSIAKYIVI